MIEGNFLYVPSASPESGEIMLLGPGSDMYQGNALVAIRYSDPQVSPPLPRFYPIIEKKIHQPVTREIREIVVNPAISRDRYLENVRKLKSQIQKGNIYEINYCLRFNVDGLEDPFSAFVRLCAIAKAPYQLMARLDESYILCASPELFLRKAGEMLYTKPIKGTIARGRNEREDALLKERLFHSIKDRTENVMAVDVARNDLSMVAERASVHVNQLYNIESFETVHQMVSTVSCRLRKHVSFQDIITATFPMASMTGAPKQRAMQLIRETEDFSRDFYSGTIGVIDSQGDFELPVIIRSVFSDDTGHWFATGGAITHLSDPEQEYKECILKASTMLRALNATLAG